MSDNKSNDKQATKKIWNDPTLTKFKKTNFIQGGSNGSNAGGDDVTYMS